MKIFITGASGFVGMAACKKLLAAGHKVRAMSRRPETDKLLQTIGVETVRCSLEQLSADDIGDADTVLHCAAFVGSWGPKDAWFIGNVKGTEAVLSAAAIAGVKRFIHIGTEAALVNGQHLCNADENYPLAPDSPYPYAATKAQAEILVRNANSAQMATIILRPRFIWGPGDTTLLPTIETMARNGNWVWINHGRAETSTTHIDNLCHAIELSLVNGRGGEAYFIIDEGNHSLRYIVEGMAASLGLELGNRSIPMWLGDTLGFLCEGLWRLFGVKSDPPLTRHAAMLMSRQCTLNPKKAKAELSYSPIVSVADGLAELKI